MNACSGDCVSQLWSLSLCCTLEGLGWRPWARSRSYQFDASDTRAEASSTALESEVWAVRSPRASLPVAAARRRGKGQGCVCARSTLLHTCWSAFRPADQSWLRRRRQRWWIVTGPEKGRPSPPIPCLGHRPQPPPTEASCVVALRSPLLIPTPSEPEPRTTRSDPWPPIHTQALLLGEARLWLGLSAVRR